MPETNKWEKGVSRTFLKILENSVNDSMAIRRKKSKEHLIHISQALLHGIHTVFPPQSVTKDGIPEPITKVKLERAEGLWETRK